MAKVLIIEDDPLMLDMYKLAFKLEGYDVELAGSGPKGIEIAKNIHPDLILIDMMMPQMSGIEVLEVLKNDPQTVNIPAVIFTNLKSLKEKDNAIAKGAKDYLIKSEITPQELVKIVGKFITLPKPQ